MSFAFEIGYEDIRSLSPMELTKLLNRLLLLDAEKLGLPKCRISVSLNIDAPDGGEDGRFDIEADRPRRIEWVGGPSLTESDWINSRTTVFQAKATQMTRSKCRNEVLVSRNGTIALKPRVAEVVGRGGSYVLFYGHPCTGQTADSWVAELRLAFAEVVGDAIAEEVSIAVYGAEKIAAWTNEHASAVAQVAGALGRALPASCETWASWRDSSSSPLSFYEDPFRRNSLLELRNVLAAPQGVARVAGLSGVGKTRLALELFRAPPNASEAPEHAALSKSCVYVADGTASEDLLRGVLVGLRNRNVRGTIVVDECPLSLHEKLEPVVTAPTSQLALLTLDLDPNSDPRSSGCRFFHLKPLPEEEMTELLRGSETGVPDMHLFAVTELAQGFPRMAQLLIEAILSGTTDLWNLTNNRAIERLIERPSKEPQRALHVARALACLEYLGVDGDNGHQLEPFAEVLCELPVNEVYAAIRELELAGIAYRRGDFVRITPPPIAVALAGQWWLACRLERARSILVGGAIPPAMVEQTANQLKRLSGNPWVEQLIGTLYGADSPFRTRDSLDSALGSRLANSLAEANPKAVCTALTLVFGEMTPADARTIGAGRQNLI